MKRTVLYSRAHRTDREEESRSSGADRTSAFEQASRSADTVQREHVPDAAAATTAPADPTQHRLFIVVASLLAACLILLVLLLVRPAAQSPAEIEAWVQRALDARDAAPAPTVIAQQTISPSVVRVRGFATADLLDDDTDAPADTPGAIEIPHPLPDEASPGRRPGSVGTGVVIVDDGTILTNLHVVAGAERIRVVFANGHESAASLVAAEPAQDLAVLQAHSIPDALVAATMRSTAGLAPGERVLAVGFPFGMGPSATAGIVSGLQREFVSPEGERVLSNLIQFDAAANPGSSGGPLVTMDGDVIGIVTGILNPTRQGVFVGIAFAVPIESAAGAAGVSPF